MSIPNWNPAPLGVWYCNIYKHEVLQDRWDDPKWEFGPPKVVQTCKLTVKELEQKGLIGVFWKPGRCRCFTFEGNRLAEIHFVIHSIHDTIQGVNVTEIAPAPAVQTNLELLNDMAYGHLWGRVDKLWGQYGTRGRGLLFHPSGLMRLGMCLGWIQGLAQTENKQLAEKIVTDLFGQLDHLANYGGTVDDTAEKKGYVPRNIVELYDDGTFNGFSVQWYRGLDFNEFRQKHDWLNCDAGTRSAIAIENKLKMHHRTDTDYTVLVRDGYNPMGIPPRYAYQRGMNGALLYHGPGGGETFSVQLVKSSFWSIHT